MSIPRVPLAGLDSDLRKHAEAINALIGGRLDALGTLTLAAGVTSTVVNDPAFISSQVPLLVPTTANAAAALSGLYVSARAPGSFTLTHASAGTTDRTYLYVRLG